MRNLKLISKKISYILRHAPEQYGLVLDGQGYVSVDDLLAVLRKAHPDWAHLNEDDLHEMILESSKKRHEIKRAKIRALYGHSTNEKIIKIPATPPGLLYHGTSPDTAKVILDTGLKPMNRQYVHLSEDSETAKQVGLRKSKTPVILTIDALKANRAGVQFYLGNEKIWLADFIPYDYLQL